MNHDFSGRIILVTGGGRGVGSVITRRFAEAGGHVAINYCHDRASAERTLAEVAEAGGTAELLRGSVARSADVERMFDELAARHGRIDILVNNAASGAFRPIAELREKDWGRALDTNVKGPLWCARRAVELMPEGSGAIVNLSSAGAGISLPDYSCVGASKAATESLTRYLAAEYGPRGVRVNTASAGPIEGPTLRLLPGAERLIDRARAATPLGRLGTADDLAQVVLFLASPGAGWITGQTILADGGLTAGAGALG